MTDLKKIKTIPVIIGLAGMIAAAFLYLDNADLSRYGPPRPDEISAVPDVLLTDIHQTTYEDGVRRLVLEAASARLIRKKQNTLINDLTLTVYATDGTASEITADRGLFSIKTGDADISGNVIIDNGTFRIHTQSLQYREKTHILSTSRPVMITGDALSLTGDSMVYDLRQMNAVVEGNVEGRF